MLSMRTFALSVFVWLAAGSMAFADVQLSFRDGHVSMVARDATIGQILAAWAKVGQTEIVNIGEIPGAPMTIELQNVSEELALAEVLRALSGYGSTSRTVDVPNASRFDRIVVVPTRAMAAIAAPPARGSAQPEFQTPTYPEPSELQTYPQQQAPPRPPPAPSSEIAAYGNVEATDATVASEMRIADQRGSMPASARRPLEIVDPRTLRLETPPGAGAVGPPAASVPAPGVARPGMIAQPSPQPVKPGGPGQSPIVRE